MVLVESQPLASIDLSALKHNYAEVRRLVGPSVSVLAMVKADAYGHGAVKVTRTLADSGVPGPDGPETHHVIGILWAEGELMGGERIWGSEACLRAMVGPLFDELERIADR